jgi:para-nitrobenzyl esterase
MMKPHLFSGRPRLLVIVGLLLLVRPGIAAIPDRVRVEQGLLSGIAGASAGVRVFKGIPFAAAPVGELRWQAPQPPKAWTGVRAADKPSANCMQRAANGGTFSALWRRSFRHDHERGLPLPERLHGRGVGRREAARDGLDSRRRMDQWRGCDLPGRGLARKGVVVVTVNYRLGVFGFLAHPS